jgi:hypothetical protein
MKYLFSIIILFTLSTTALGQVYVTPGQAYVAPGRVIVPGSVDIQWNRPFRTYRMYPARPIRTDSYRSDSYRWRFGDFFLSPLFRNFD